MKIGDLIENRYRIEELIGRGGTSSVYLVYDIQLKKLWVAKVYQREYLNSSIETCNYINAEVEMLSQLKHPGIPHIEAVVDSELYRAIIMEHIEGTNLDRYIQEGGNLPQQRILFISQQVIEIFKYIHSKNIVYRDLKPSNIIIQNGDRVRLIDFGTARFYTKDKSEETISLGTIGYAAPEQYAVGQTDWRADIYGFGMTLRYMTTGHSPIGLQIDYPSIQERRPDLSAKFDYIIRKCTCPSPRDRYQSFEAVGADLLKIHAYENGERYRISRALEKLFRIDLRREKKSRDTWWSAKSHSKPSMAYDGYTVILSRDYVEKYNYTTVLGNEQSTVFLSYCSSDSDLADIICEKLSPYSYIKISRYTTDVPYKSSFKEFMRTLKSHDKVIMIITDSYMKSRACMYEASQLAQEPNYADKVLFVVCSDGDSVFYKKEVADIHAKIYDLHNRNQYIKYWENKCEILEKDVDEIKSPEAREKTKEEIRFIHNMIRDIIPFFEYLSDVRGISFKELYEHRFAEFLNEIAQAQG